MRFPTIAWLTRLGEIRSVAIARSDLFCLPGHIQTYVAGVFETLAEEHYLRRLPPQGTTRPRAVRVG